jgi:hypothetical protein
MLKLAGSGTVTVPINTVEKGIIEHNRDTHLLHPVKKNELGAPIKTNYN